MKQKNNFDEIYNSLNKEQLEAVNTIYGPVLVLAGPGTGKTQLLSARVANILKKTDVAPQNILCLTFTENGAENMRERLANFIGAKAAHDVEVSTYHGFGNSLLSQGRDYIESDRESIDELQQFQIIYEIKQNLPNSNLLSPEINTVKNILSSINDIKQEDISPKVLKNIAEQNLHLIKKAAPFLETLNNLSDTKMIRKPDGSKISATQQKVEILAEVYEKLKSVDEPRIHHKTPTFLEKICASFEEQFIKFEADPKKSIQNLTKDWKEKFFSKNGQNCFKFYDEFASLKAIDLAEIYQNYSDELEKRNQQDFNDIILRAIKLLKNNADFKFTMQEKYQFILLDEYQDTNGAQSEIIELLTSNEFVDDFSPNILAVGDDDQAIMAFQGAKFSNLEDFANFYSNIKIVNLIKNYRSHEKILEFAQNISIQINSRLSNSFPDINKQIFQTNQKIIEPKICRKVFRHQSTEFTEIAEKICQLILSGIQPKEIAILAPKHKILEEIAKYLNAKNIPLRYEKSENILDEIIVHEIISMLKLAKYINENSVSQNSTWAKVLSFDFWQLTPISVYNEIQKFDRWDKNSKNLTTILLESENKNISQIANFFVEVSLKFQTENFENFVDKIIGTTKCENDFISPFRGYYQRKSPEDFYNLALYLTTLRDKFIANSNVVNQNIFTNEFLKMINLYEESETKILNRNPFSTEENSVQIMTAFSAKGLEFEHTFLVSVDDSSWGSARGNRQTISLPKNLERIKDPNSDDTKKRLFFVAVTRAKAHLYLTSSDYSFGSSKQNSPLKYMAENRDEMISEVLPKEFAQMEYEENKMPDQKVIGLNWTKKFTSDELKIEQVFAEKIKKFTHSASGLTKYFDLQYGGPQKFFEEYILCFPQETSGSARFGTLMHEIFDFWQKQLNLNIEINLNKILKITQQKIGLMRISDFEKNNEIYHATQVFSQYFQSRAEIFERTAKSEVNIRKIPLNGVAKISGKIDRIEIDEKNKTIEIVDFKTGNIDDGKYADNFKSKPKLHRYKTQLYFYKLLLNNSPEYGKYVVKFARLEFVEGNKSEKIPIIKRIEFNAEEEKHVINMILALEAKIKNFDFVQGKHDKRNISVNDLIDFENQIIEETFKKI